MRRRFFLAAGLPPLVLPPLLARDNSVEGALAYLQNVWWSDDYGVWWRYRCLATDGRNTAYAIAHCDAEAYRNLDSRAAVEGDARLAARNFLRRHAAVQQGA